MNERKIPTAILGASGYIGQHFARLLHDHPTFAAPLLAGGARSAGQPLGELWQLAEAPPGELASERVRQTTPSQLARAGVRVVFSALPSGTAGAVESELARRGIAVFSNASDHRMDRPVPLLVPEVNARHLELARRRRGGRGLLVTNPNCSAAGLVVALAPLMRRLRPVAVHVATYQALSGAGYPGVPSLAITDNVVPYIRDEEEKLADESRRILGSLASGGVRPLRLPMAVHCVRVGTREGHLEAVTIESRERIDLSEVTEAWTSFDPLAGTGLPTAPHPPVVVRREADRPQPLRDRWAGAPASARGMAVSVGRLRTDGRFLRFFVLSHNAVRGGAGGSVLNAELAVARGLLGERAT